MLDILSLFVWPVSFFLVAFSIIFLRSKFFVVPQGYKVVCERLGIYSRTLGPGFHFLLLEQPRSVSWTRNSASGKIQHRSTRIPTFKVVHDVEEYEILCQNAIRLRVDVVFVSQIIDPMKASYNCEDVWSSVELLMETLINQICNENSLDEITRNGTTLISRILPERLANERIDENWGVVISELRIQSVSPPDNIIENNQLLERRFANLKAEQDINAALLDLAKSKQERVSLEKYAELQHEAKLMNEWKKALGSAELAVEWRRAIAMEKASFVPSHFGDFKARVQPPQTPGEPAVSN